MLLWLLLDIIPNGLLSHVEILKEPKDEANKVRCTIF